MKYHIVEKRSSIDTHCGGNPKTYDTFVDSNGIETGNLKEKNV